MNRNKLDKAIERILFEDMSFGLHSKVSTIHDRPITSGEPDVNFKPNMASTMQSSVPLRPSELMATQLADERPPIEDLEYSPVSVPALKAAVSALADLVPPDQVTRFYRRAQELLDDVTERQAEGEIAKSAEVEEELKLANDKEEEDVMSKNTKNESIANRRVRLTKLISLLREATNPYDSAVVGSGGDEFDPAPPSATSANTSEMSLEDLAEILGYKSGASGAAQSIQDTFLKIRWILESVSNQSFEEFKDNAYDLYVQSLKDDYDSNHEIGANFVDLEDIEFLSEPGMRETLKESPGFRYFFNHAIIEPAWKSVKNSVTTSIKNSLADIPENLHQMILNILKGETKGNVSSLIDRRINSKIVGDETLKKNLKAKINSIISSIDTTKKDAGKALLDQTSYYTELNDDKKNDILAQSLAQLHNDQDKLDLLDRRSEEMSR